MTVKELKHFLETIPEETEVRVEETVLGEYGSFLFCEDRELEKTDLKLIDSSLIICP